MGTAASRMASEFRLAPRTRVIVFAGVMAFVIFLIAVFAVTTVRAVDDDVIATITVPESISISASSDARDRWDAWLEVTGGVVNIGSPGDTISVPVKVPGGWWLESLTDPTTGITIVRGAEETVLRIPIRDDQGNDTIRVLVNTTDFIGDGTSAQATIVSMSIDLPTRSRDFAEVDAEVGEASVKILGDITGFPGDSIMEMSIAKTAAENDLGTVQQLAEADGLEIADIAYVVGLAKTNLDQVLGEMTLRLTVGKAWIERHGVENVRVVRIADDGAVQTFSWVPVDLEADPVQFNLISPDGLSKFVIEALRKAQPTPTPTATPSPTPTTIPTATPTPTPTIAPSPTSTSTPVPPSSATASFTPTVSPAVTTTSQPTVVPTLAATPTPTMTAVPTLAPTSTATPKPAPTATSAPTSTPVTLASTVPSVSPASEEISETSDASSCNAVGQTGHVGIGQLAFLFFPVGLVAYRRVISRKRDS